MHSRDVRRLDELETRDQQVMAASKERRYFELLPCDFNEHEWELLQSAVWQMIADSDVNPGSSFDFANLSAEQLRLWEEASAVVCGPEGGSQADDQLPAALAVPEGASVASSVDCRPWFVPSQRNGRSPIAIISQQQDDLIRSRGLTLPSYVRILISDNGRDHHRHLRRQLEWLISH